MAPRPYCLWAGPTALWNPGFFSNRWIPLAIFSLSEITERPTRVQTYSLHRRIRCLPLSVWGRTTWMAIRIERCWNDWLNGEWRFGVPTNQDLCGSCLVGASRRGARIRYPLFHRAQLVKQLTESRFAPDQVKFGAGHPSQRLPRIHERNGPLQHFDGCIAMDSVRKRFGQAELNRRDIRSERGDLL